MFFLWKRKIRRRFCQLWCLPWELRSWLRRKLFLLNLTLKSLFYNEFVDFGYCGEVLLEPMVWVVDHCAKFLGPVLVCGVVFWTSTVVAIVHAIGLPYYWHKSPWLTVVLMILGHWLLINVVFHYYMAYVSGPGTPPQGTLICEAVSMCKKCIAPKPPRTHHCSVCNHCVLKMDHHCPWLNNCIGHWNHRYFLQYMIFMVAGVLFIAILGFEIAHQELWIGQGGVGGWKEGFVHLWESWTSGLNGSEETLEGFPVRVNGTHMVPVVNGTIGQAILLETPDEESDADEDEIPEYRWHRFCVLYVSMLITGQLLTTFVTIYQFCSALGVVLSLGTLVVWHCRLISRGETSIEAHINKKERQRLAQSNQEYKNPYDFGTVENWKIFLGLTNGRTFMRHIMWPSRHPPIGTGLTWLNAIVADADKDHDKAA